MFSVYSILLCFGLYIILIVASLALQYNAVLRGFPAEDVECLLDNKYATTIFTIASAITKLSRVTDIPIGRRLWRGLGGMILPDQFWSCFAECIVTFRIETAPLDKEMARNALRDLIKTDKSTFNLEEEVLILVPGTGRAALWPPPLYQPKKVKVISSAELDAEGRVTVAQPMSKYDFMHGIDQGALDKTWEKVFKEALCTCIVHVCTSIHHEKLLVKIEAVADNPRDFRGGGAIESLLRSLKFDLFLAFRSLVKLAYVCVHCMLSLRTRPHLIFEFGAIWCDFSQLSTDSSRRRRNERLRSHTAVCPRNAASSSKSKLEGSTSEPA